MRTDACHLRICALSIWSFLFYMLRRPSPPRMPEVLLVDTSGWEHTDSGMRVALEFTLDLPAPVGQNN